MVQEQVDWKNDSNYSRSHLAYHVSKKTKGISHILN